MMKLVQHLKLLKIFLEQPHLPVQKWAMSRAIIILQLTATICPALEQEWIVA